MKCTSRREAVLTGGRSFLPFIQLTENKNYTLRVEGTDGLMFCSVISIMRNNEETKVDTLDGTVPETFSVFGESVSVNFRKCHENGLLKVAIAEGSGHRCERSTIEEYGGVEVSMK